MVTIADVSSSDAFRCLIRAERSRELPRKVDGWVSLARDKLDWSLSSVYLSVCYVRG
jgi:hypothetical protein